MMGRSIPSFRPLIDIERQNWSEFKKELPSKRDKQAFDLIFENAILSTSYLSNANNPIPLDSILMSTLFHNYKVFSESNKNKKNSSLENESEGGISFENRNTIYAKSLPDNIFKKWKGLIYSLHRNDEKLLLAMLSAACQNNEKLSIFNPEDSKFNLSILVHLAVILHNQKLIDKIRKK